MNFLCISLFLRLMYFIVFLYGIVWVLNINKYNSDFNCNESKYCILELKMEFWHKKPFSICFVHKSRKFSNFELALDYIMLRNFGTVRPIFLKIAAKVAQDFKEKSHKSSRRGKKFPQNYRAKRRGGADSAPPPPPALLGLIRISPLAQSGRVVVYWSIHSTFALRARVRVSRSPCTFVLQQTIYPHCCSRPRCIWMGTW